MSASVANGDSFYAEINEACDRFEAEWRSGGQPQIEVYVAEVAKGARSELVRELLKLDIYYRRERGATILPGDYESYPEHATLINELLGPCTLTEPTHAGRYRLGHEIGHGGMGNVYRAHDSDFRRTLAVKVLKEDYKDSRELTARFLEEARITGQLQHPGVPPVHEIGRLSDGRPFLAMKLIEGRTLADLLAERSSPSDGLPRFLTIFEQICQTLAYAQSRGIIHRDLKPANIMVGAYGEVQVMDWGLAKVRAPANRADESPDKSPTGATQTPSVETVVEPTQRGAVLGTLAYMPPEQARGEVDLVDERSDVFGLGAILCVILTGHPPYRGGSGQELQQQAVGADLADAFARLDGSGADAKVVALATGCLAKAQSDRPPDAAAVAVAVADYQESVRERLRRAELDRASAEVTAREERKRRRMALALGSAVLFVIFAGVAGVIWQWRAAVAGRQKAYDTAYARTIGQSYAEWLAGNADPDRLLSDCDPDSRGWEWHYLRRLLSRQMATLQGHADSVLAVAISPDGSRIASGGADGIVKVWDRQSQREIHTLRGHAGTVKTMAFSPDGWQLASGSNDGELRIWDIVRGENLLRWRGHAAAVTGLAFDSEGTRLASTGKGESSLGELKLWDAGKGAALASKTWHTPLAAVAFSPDARRLVTADHDGNVVAWDSAALKPIGSLARPDKRIVRWTSVAFGADGEWIAAGSSAGLVRVWDGKTAKEFITPTRASVSGVAFSSRDGSILTAACADNTVCAWFTKSGEPAFTLRGHRGGVTAVACSSDGACLASGSLDRTVKLWDIRSRNEDLTLRATERYRSIAFSPAGTYLASAPSQNALLIWDMTTGKAVAHLRSLPESVNGLAFNAEGDQFACAGNDGIVRIREVPTGRETRLLQGHNGSVNAVAYHPDVARLASAGEDGTVRLWEVPSRLETLCLRGHDGAVHAVAFSPDGGRLASAGEDGVVRVWDAGTGQELLALTDEGRPVYAVAFNADGRRLAVAGQDEIVRVWDAAGGKLLQKLPGHMGAVRSLAYGPGGRLASAGDDRAVRLWDPAGHELLVLRGHKDVVRAVAFSLDGHRLASAGDDRTIKVWDGTPLNEASATGK